MPVEGFWHIGSGLQAQEIVETIPRSTPHITRLELRNRANLWDDEVSDERYVSIAKF